MVNPLRIKVAQHEIAEAKQIIAGLILQFAREENGEYFHGFLSCLERAWDFFGWEYGNVTEKQLNEFLCPYNAQRD